MTERFITYSRFVKIEHTLFSFPMLLSGALLARDDITIRVFLLILVAGTGARITALSLNRILDRHIDGDNPRTKNRELPGGTMKLTEACLVTSLGTALYLTAAYLISPSCLAWSPLPLAVFVTYPLLKRFTMWAHLGVGAGLAMGPLGAWYAVNLGFDNPIPIMLLTLFTFFWVTGFDIIYATLDEEFDRSYGLNSLPARLGRHRALNISFAFRLAAFLLLCLLYWVALEGIITAILLLVIGYLLYLEHRKADNVDLAFFKINAIVGFLVLIFVSVGLGLLSVRNLA